MSDRIAVMDKGLIAEIGTPAQLCDRPRSAFTAKFLGARTVVDGTVREGVFHAQGLHCREAPEGAAQMVLRASRLRFAETRGERLALSGTIVTTSYLGETFEIDVQSACGTIRMIVPSDTPPPPVGSTCHIEPLPGGITFI